MTITIIKRGKARRLKSKHAMNHKPTVWGKGKWESLTTLWKYKRKARRKNQIAAASRRRNARG